MAMPSPAVLVPELSLWIPRELFEVNVHGRSNRIKTKENQYSRGRERGTRECSKGLEEAVLVLSALLSSPPLSVLLLPSFVQSGDVIFLVIKQMALFDDDDDEFPQLKDVDQYACKDSHEDLVCFSILPFWFDEEHRLPGSEKGVYIRGIDCEGRQPVYKRIEAWRVELDCEKPMISVLSSEGNWIRLLNPHPGYAEDIARSVLITIQMIHFVRKHPAKDERTLSKHLCEVFRKFFTKPPEVDDLRKSYSLIKYFMKMDQTLVKSKILRRPLEDTWIIIETELRKASPNESFIVSNESSTNCDDYTEDGSSGSSDDNGDNYTDGNASDDGTEAVCAICDQGGILLGCKGECKRSFHPKLEDGTKFFCKTLGYTSREVEEIPIFICSNCQHKQHQCFKCGQLDSSHETNPKVFQCCNASCGRFYHPKCVAGLLEPDGACGLEKRIADGMTFTCPVHWCFECKQIEDRSQTQLWLAVCRRCVRSYHKKCLPRKFLLKRRMSQHVFGRFPKEILKYSSTAWTMTLMLLLEHLVGII
ncbi:protein ENHANCED DOWNY MILDEW 2-like [Oryza glaberrima]|uniref:protein ENHANCED DOWNY MILDEW 2-like n=1 Tax=Oryza glaberrima TaxID=4538 RepID=UPI00224BFE22|nr:protein ENHANCED DOWNY MILDEW 2-like [Oryza glaberrima]